MLEKINTTIKKFYSSQYSDVRSLALMVFAVIVILVSWSGVKAIQKNYELQKQIAQLEQENSVKKLENDNQKLKNTYLETDQFLELAARKQFGLAAPGETVVIIPERVAFDRIPEMPSVTKQEPVKTSNKPEYQKNIESWLDFFLGRD